MAAHGKLTWRSFGSRVCIYWIHSVTLRNFLFSKIKEQFPEDFFCLFKVSETKWWADAWVILMLLCDWILLWSFKCTKPLSVSPASGIAQAVCWEGAPSCAGPPVCAAGSFNTALGEQAEHLGPHFPLQKWMLKDDVTRVLPWLFLQVFSFVFITTTPPPPPNLQCSCIIGLEHGLTWPYRQYELRTLDTINIVVFPPFASLRLWLHIYFLWWNGKCTLKRLLNDLSK